MLVKVRRQNKFSRDSKGKRDVWFLFGGERFEVGETFDTRRFDAAPDKWGRLVDQGFLDRVEDDGTVTNRLVRDRKKPAKADPIVVEAFQALCPFCGHQAKNELGVKQHIGRKHKELKEKK